MKWKKIGQIYKVEPIHPKLLTHASNPLAIHLENGTYRIYYSGRDRENKSSVSFIDYDIENRKITYIHKEPIFNFGQKNSFYSHGVSIGTTYSIDRKKYILFMGWNIKNGEHWKGDIGRLRILNNNNFLKLDPEIPFISKDKIDPISLSYPWVIFHEGIYKMWYGSTITWEAGNDEMIHVIKYATSKNGENWEKKGIAIPYKIGFAQAFSRPCVIVHKNIFHMWYSYRDGKGTKYRIGYAKSNNGIDWKLSHREVGINVSKEGWDKEMICYPYVIHHNDKFYMIYNGNGYGKNGFGLAILANSEF